MDDGTNGEYSRPPEPKDVIDLCRSLNEQGVRYMLIGGFAVVLYGFGRFTKDIDLLVDTSIENILKLKKALASLPDNAISLMENDELEKYKVVRIADEFVIDLMAKACGINFEEAFKTVEYKTVHDIQIPVPSKETLIRMKDTIRLSDKIDADFLKSEIEREKKGK